MTAPEFLKLYNSAFPIMYRVSYRITNSSEATEDLCQDAFFSLFEKNMVFPNFDEATRWLIRVVKNATLNYATRKLRERRAYQRVLNLDKRRPETGEEELIKNETKSVVLDALNKLPDHLRVTLILKEYAGMKNKEIARMLGIREANVKVRIFRARKRLIVILHDVIHEAQILTVVSFLRNV